MQIQTAMEYVLIVLLLAGDYLLMLSYVRNTPRAVGNLAPLALILLVIFGAAGAAFVVVASRIMELSMLLMAILLISVTAFLYSVYHILSRNEGDVNRGMLVLLLTYLLAVGYIAIFSRQERGRSEIILSLQSLLRAVQTNDAKTLQHFYLNIAMFVPMGLLLPAVDPKRLGSLVPVLALSVLFTSLIESVQLLFRLGIADVGDLLANALGGVLGWLCIRIAGRRLFR